MMGNVTSGSPVGSTQKTWSYVRNVQSRLCLVPGHYVTFPWRPEKQGIRGGHSRATVSGSTLAGDPW